MDILSAILIIAGLILFETITSIDNAIINAEVLSTMSAWARRWFLVWGLLIAVFVVRGRPPLAHRVDVYAHPGAGRRPHCHVQQ